jgi:hypothetical protein
MTWTKAVSRLKYFIAFQNILEYFRVYQRVFENILQYFAISHSIFQYFREYSIVLRKNFRVFQKQNSNESRSQHLNKMNLSNLLDGT